MGGGANFQVWYCSKKIILALGQISWVCIPKIFFADMLSCCSFQVGALGCSLTLFFEICNENFQFCTKMYTRSMRYGIEFVSNNQTVLIWLFFAKTLCEIDLFSFNKMLLHENFIDSLVDRCANISDVTCCNYFICSWMSHGSCIHF